MTNAAQEKLDAESHELAKIEALAKHLDVEQDEAQSLYDDGDYLVLTDEEADEQAREYILDSLWAFNYSFLCTHSDAISNIPEKDFTDMQGKLCESFNKAVLAMIDGVDHFVDDAIATDGRGHFLSGYDGEENEQAGFYIYRTN